MKKHIYKHLGYYNKIPDIREYSRKSADEILEAYKKGYGHFYEDTFPDPDDILVREEEDECVARGDTKFTTDGKYAVTDTSWEGWKEEYADAEDGDASDDYIDIWELVEEREDNTTAEVCPYCGKEVEIDAELKVQKCPNCGKYIVTCSMCLNPDLNYKCGDCCLEILAHKLNEDSEE